MYSPGPGIISPLFSSGQQAIERKLREAVEKKYAEALNSAGFFGRIYLTLKIEREIYYRETLLLRSAR